MIATYLSSNMDEDTSYQPHVVYEYQVDGRNYSSERISISLQNSYSDYTWPRSYMDRYAVGSSVAVHYDPDDPASAVIETGMELVGYVPLIVGVGFIVVSAIIFGAWRYLKRGG